MATILLTHPPLVRENYYSDRALAALTALGDVRRNPLGRELSTSELVAAARDCEVVVTHRHVPGDAGLFAGLPRLVAFCRCAMDIRNVDVEAASANGVLVTHASAGFIAATAEWVLGAMIDLGRDISLSTVDYRNGKVREATMGRQLKGSVLGVIGYGQIGRYLCEIAGALGMRVLVTDPYAKATTQEISQVALPQLLAQSDFVACLAVATAETENLMDEKSFASMKPGAFFVNASRGNLVDEHALLQALDSGHLAGCAMDVGREHDQKPSMTLARHPKVVATPHVGGLTPPATEHQAMETVAQVAEILKGRAPKGAVNAERASRLSRFLA
ncbi:MAG TPA: NAD(P)-dependent oxidoreductase [Burkholderiales bacterium]|nr:NAD(P)-dependent oxidoreductase [Burkholderiales bacterium]